jgi:hypothetical protein
MNVRKLVEGDLLTLEPHLDVMLPNGERYTSKTTCKPEDLKETVRKLCSEADGWIASRKKAE